ncbi:hypothetical protein PVK06_014983 [Gossypium arboreum]|uniref:RNase H type-1 domain-containing protein n=1 Tax=Gossypium arboreum TaxID=29729 RepID=A0ABR0PWW0_GOSAR|nr:hypothetical protein PVK06_014983 [Gossypium arboreum]
MNNATDFLAIGGVVRDSKAEWIIGYAQRLKATSVFQAEARAFLEGLQIVWNMGLCRMVAERDNALLIKLLRDKHGGASNITEVQ